MAHTTKRLSRAEVQFETERLLKDLRRPGSQKEFDWIPEVTGLMEELLALAQSDAPDQTEVAELSRRIHEFLRRPHMKGLSYIQAWVDSLIEKPDN